MPLMPEGVEHEAVVCYSTDRLAREHASDAGRR